MIEHGLSFGEYVKRPGLNWSTLKEMCRSPAHYKAALVAPREDNSALLVGRATHTAILEPDEWTRRYAIWDAEANGMRRGKVWEAFRDAAEADGKDVLTSVEAAECLALQAAVRSNADAMRLLSGGESEVSAAWKQGARDCRGRVDYIGPTKTIVDVKTCRSAEPREFAAAAWRLGYVGQAAWYVDGLALAGGLNLRFAIVAVEKAGPHAVQVYEFDEADLELGREQYMRALARLAVCESTGQWPGYSDGPVRLPIPAYAFREMGFTEDDGDLGEELSFATTATMET